LCHITQDTFSKGDFLGGDSSDHSEDDLEVYFPLPTNEEQRQIVGQLRTRQGVLVQGPPGTGKSHTIANFICHLLATGKRILVTSQTPRALKVLKEKVPKELSELCVHVLGNDRASLEELEKSVRGISDRFYRWEPRAHKQQVRNLEREVYEQRKHQAEINLKLRELRERDIYQHRVPGTTYLGTAQSIAQKLAEHRELYGWFLDILQPNTEMPLDISQFHELLSAFRRLPPARCKELDCLVIDQTAIPDIASFLSMIRAEGRALESRGRFAERASQESFRILGNADKSLRLELANTLRDLLVAIGNIARRPLPWIPQAIQGILTDQDRPWKELYATTQRYLTGLLQKAQSVQVHTFHIPTRLDHQKLKIGRASCRERV